MHAAAGGGEDAYDMSAAPSTSFPDSLADVLVESGLITIDQRLDVLARLLERQVAEGFCGAHWHTSHVSGFSYKQATASSSLNSVAGAGGSPPPIGVGGGGASPSPLPLNVAWAMRVAGRDRR